MASRALARSVAKRVINRGGETIRPFAAIAASDLAPVLGQDEQRLFEWSSPETQNFTHRGIWRKTSARFVRLFYVGLERKRERESEGDLFSSSLPLFLSLSLSTLFVRGRKEELDRPATRSINFSLSLSFGKYFHASLRGQYSFSLLILNTISSGHDFTVWFTRRRKRRRSGHHRCLD